MPLQEIKLSTQNASSLILKGTVKINYSSGLKMGQTKEVVAKSEGGSWLCNMTREEKEEIILTAITN